MTTSMTIMDVLKPEILNIEGRRYRIPFVKEKKPKEKEEEPPLQSYTEEDMYYDDEEESCAIEYETLEQYENGFRDYIRDIPSFYFRFLIGTGGKKKIALEKQTHTNIKLPKFGSDGDIVITGHRRSNVLAAKARLKAAITMNRGEQPADHFLSISLVSSELKDNFEDFKKRVLEMKSRGIDASLFQLPERLHLTLCLLVFLNDAELKSSLTQMNEIVKDLQEQHFGGSGALNIRIQGIEYMNDDPGEVDVLYAKIHLPDGSNRLQEFCDDLVLALVSNGYLKKQYDRVKLHATIINSLFRDDRENSTPRSDDKNREKPTPYNKYKNKKQRVTFDAESVLKTYSDFFFGDVEVSSLDVSLRRQFGPDGHYKQAASLSLT